MSNTRRGTEYERAYRHVLERAGFIVTRSAASKGPYDLVAVSEWRCVHVQLKTRSTCAAARRLVDVLRLPSTCYLQVVHRTRTQEYCVHDECGL